MPIIRVNRRGSVLGADGDYVRMAEEERLCKGHRQRVEAIEGRGSPKVAEAPHAQPALTKEPGKGNYFDIRV